MKNIFWVLVALSPLVSPTLAQTPDEDCAALGAMAEDIMWIRQNGGVMSELIARVGHVDLFRQIVLDAYARPRWPSESFQKTEVENFRNEVEHSCFSDFR